MDDWLSLGHAIVLGIEAYILTYANVAFRNGTHF